MERLLNSDAIQDQIDGMHAAAYRDPDDEWVLNQLAKKMMSGDPRVRYASASFSAAFIGMGRSLEPDRTRIALEAARERFPDLAPAVDDALDELTQRNPQTGS